MKMHDFAEPTAFAFGARRASARSSPGRFKPRMPRPPTRSQSRRERWSLRAEDVFLSGCGTVESPQQGPTQLREARHRVGHSSYYMTDVTGQGIVVSRQPQALLI